MNFWLRPCQLPHVYGTSTLHPFNGLFSRTTLVSWHHWVLLEQEMTGWQWHQLDHMQIIYTSLQTDNHASTSPVSFYRPDALPAAQPTASKHWRHTCIQYLQMKTHSFMAIIQDNLHWSATRVKNWRILLEQGFTANMPSLMATSAIGLGRRRWSSQLCYLTISVPSLPLYD